MSTKGIPSGVDGYNQRYVAFLDLLGFKALVERAEREPAEQERLMEVLRLLRDTLCQAPAISMQFTYFSDCILISAERSAAGLWQMLCSIDILTCNLLQFDVLARGGLAAGGAFHTEEFVFGTSVNHATELEEQARWPLTLLSSEVLEDAKTYGQLFLDLLSTDAQGRPFVHYLSSYASYRKQPVWPGKVVMEPAGDRVIYFVCQRLGRDEGTVLEKAQWFQAYWNQSVAPHGVFSAIEIGASPTVPTGPPTIIMRRLVAPPPHR
ncbi:MAG: hypothetical protein WCF26_05485 [Candidatus Sulfotelmatobacter sp.]